MTNPPELAPSVPPVPTERARSAPRRASLRFMLEHPAHLLALAFGAGLSPKAPGTVGTLWAWAGFLILERWTGGVPWGLVIAAGTLIGWWACAVTARHLEAADPSAIVLDEVLAFWAVLWLVMPAGFLMQLAAFLLFRIFDAIKVGPVGWADALFKTTRSDGGVGWAQGFGIIFDDAVAALCALVVIALWRF